MNSIKFRIIISICIATILVAISLLITFNITLENRLIVFLIYLVIALIINSFIGSIIADNITKHIRRFEKNMKQIIEGKSIYKSAKSTEFNELKDLSDAFSELVSTVKNNNVDLSSQKIKTDIILENMTDGVIAFNLDREVIHMNKSAIKLLSISEYDDNYDKLHKKLKLNTDFEKILYSGNSNTIDTKIIVGNTNINIKFIPFFDNRYKPMGVIMVARNITESVKLDNIRREFVANVSHELKTPLTSIKGYSETILDGDVDKDSVKHFAKVINEEANRMNKLVSDLLRLSKFDYRKVSWNKTRFDLGELTKHICDKMKISALDKKHNLSCDIVSYVPYIFADKDAIEQVVINVISNSIKYTSEGGNIEVYVGAMHNSAYVKVKDNGIGIPQRELSRIFERFYRVDKARSREMGGTGLGLSIVKEILDNIGGDIEIKSEVGKGTEVIISLPIKEGENKK